jgi:hypothetical protein
MGPLEADSAVLLLSAASPTRLQAQLAYKPKSATSLIQNPDNLYTISGAPVTDMTADTRGYPIPRWKINAYRRDIDHLDFCSAT